MQESEASQEARLFCKRPASRWRHCEALGKALALGVLTILFGSICCGCASTPQTRYYTLDMSPSGTAHAPCDIKIERIDATEALSRKEILVLRSPTQVEYYALDAWVENVGELARRKLQAEFGRNPDASRTLTARGRLEHFEQVDGPAGPEAWVQLRLTFQNRDKRPRTAPVLEQTYEVRRPAEDSGQGAAANVVKALSSALEQIARDVTRDMVNL